MEISRIKELAEILTEKNLTLLEVSEGETKIKLEKAAPAPVFSAPPAQVFPKPEPILGAGSAPGADSLDFNRLIEVRSPLVGVFYSAPEPDADSFVSIGSKVKKGDVLCIVETMKVMNEILSEHDGEIADICIKNGEIAEFGQVLFKIF